MFLSQSTESNFFVCFQDLGSSAGSKRPTCVILIKPHQDYQEAYDECVEEVSSLPKPLWDNSQSEKNLWGPCLP